ncbi:hypothetical protein U1Q18_025406, partial [Sarracenia purpurea var. burkii]
GIQRWCGAHAGGMQGTGARRARQQQCKIGARGVTARMHGACVGQWQQCAGAGL